VFDGVCTLYSRTGKEFTTLNKVKEAIEATGIINVTFDGEICLVDDNGNEDFQGIMKQLRKKDHQIPNPAYMIFDMLTNEEFDNTKGDKILSERLHTLRSWLGGKFINKSILRYTEQSQITDNDHFNYWSEKPKQEGWEGIMLRKNVGYEGKRTKNLMKVKKFFDAEYKVVDVDFDNHEVVRDGRSETIKMLAQVWIEHKGHRVKVGSGFSQDQRIQYMTDNIIGKIFSIEEFFHFH
jgi:DNA ligase-1